MVFRVKILDSSFLISFYLTEDTNHENALKLAEENKNETMLLCDVILFETLTILNYKKNINFAKYAFNELLENKNIRFFHLTDAEKDEILNGFFNQRIKLSFQDVSVIYLANKGKSEALAFDKGILDNIAK